MERAQCTGTAVRAADPFPLKELRRVAGGSAEEVEARREALQSVRVAIEELVAQRRPTGAVATAIANELTRLLGSASWCASSMRSEAVRCVGLEEREAHRRFAIRLRDLERDLAYRPVAEAAAVSGFPRPTPAGEICIRECPPSRWARVRWQVGESRSRRAFVSLFEHIRRHRIPMIAPVWKQIEEGRWVSMAFAYPSLEEGTLGRDRGVEVIDEPARVSASIGLRGSLSLDRAVVSAEAVRHWTREHLTGWRVCDGAVNVAGWNSPFVAASCRAWEVQIRIEPGTGLEAGRTT